MTPLELAAEIERMDQYGARAADRALIVAAIRYAEAADAYEEFARRPLPTRLVASEHDIEEFRRALDDHDQHGQELLLLAREALAAYRAARQP